MLLIRGVTLEGAWLGIKFYLTPQFELLLSPKVRSVSILLCKRVDLYTSFDYLMFWMILETKQEFLDGTGKSRPLGRLETLKKSFKKGNSISVMLPRKLHAPETDQGIINIF